MERCKVMGVHVRWCVPTLPVIREAAGQALCVGAGYYSPGTSSKYKFIMDEKFVVFC